MQAPLIDRRKFIRMGLITAAATVIPCNALASVYESASDVRELHFYNLYTYEDLKITYWREGWYIPEALSDINHIFRDIRTGKVKAINKELLDLLFNIRKKINVDAPFQIVSGYRTPQSNAILRKLKKGVAKNSLHMYGKAVDIRVPGFSLRTLRREAKKLELGGVGYYPQAHFVHVDVGEVRYWRG
ncbi:MAG TPA: DUF882 domain-containing protein [Nitrospirae bacterium]|nr:DUF882 domain-containing protein [Nitrospirota bacterium]